MTEVTSRDEENASQKWVPCKRPSSVTSGAWLRRFDDVTGVAKTDIFR